jgi:uncharacterized protein (TIGR02246 family)
MNMDSAHRKVRVWAWRVCVLAVISTAAFSQANPGTAAGKDEAALRELDTRWSKTAMANDLDGTVSYYAEDASLMPPNAPIATGKQAIREVWTKLLTPDSSVSWQPTKVEVSRSGDLGYLLGTYQITQKNSHLVDRGKLVEVWKKQPDGQWKAVADIFNSDLPLPTAPK